MNRGEGLHKPISPDAEGQHRSGKDLETEKSNKSIIPNLQRKIVDIYRKTPIKSLPLLDRSINKLYKKYKLHNKNRTVIDEIDGIKYELNLNEVIDSSIYYEGAFEPTTTEAIKKNVKEGMTVLDVGANIGCHTLLFAKLVGNKGNVIAFEPTSFAFSKLKRNTELNNFNNIKLEKIALSNVNTSQDIHFQSSWTIDGTPQQQNSKEFMNITKLDDYVQKNHIDKIDFIKLDVDGYEYKVINGGLATLKRDKPLLLVEMGIDTLKTAGDNIYDLVNTLAETGYTFYSENDLKNPLDTRNLIKSIPKNGTINVLCLQPKTENSIPIK